MKIKLFLISLIITLIIFSCKNDDDSVSVDDFDHAAQSLKDNDSLIKYLSSHYYTPPTSSENFGRIDTLENGGQTSMLAQAITQIVTIAEIDFTLYYIKNNPEGVNQSPSRIDSVLVKYQGSLMNYSDEPIFDERINYNWLLLNNTIPGWSYGFPNFKSGNNTSIIDQPLSFENTGTGMLFLPSGLAYRNLGTTGISPNLPIMFHIELAQVIQADHDFDGISSNYENLNGNDDYNDDDTDDNSVPNFADTDDDGDQLFTIFENADLNEDGNPSDAIDTDNDGKPDFLDNDDDGDGILTINENADQDRNGSPDDARDSDGDNIPDYLDSDS